MSLADMKNPFSYSNWEDTAKFEWKGILECQRLTDPWRALVGSRGTTLATPRVAMSMQTFSLQRLQGPVQAVLLSDSSATPGACKACPDPRNRGQTEGLLVSTWWKRKIPRRDTETSELFHSQCKLWVSFAHTLEPQQEIIMKTTCRSLKSLGSHRIHTRSLPRGHLQTLAG